MFTITYHLPFELSVKSYLEAKSVIGACLGCYGGKEFKITKSILEKKITLEILVEDGTTVLNAISKLRRKVGKDSYTLLDKVVVNSTIGYSVWTNEEGKLRFAQST